VCLNAGDWSQYRGPHGDGICTETPNLNWPASGPKVVWKVPVKNGFSSFTISGGKAFTQMNRDIDGAPREVCVALDIATGKELWATPVGVGTYDGGGDSVP
jgi:outer membrane protein assembly factor BamB